MTLGETAPRRRQPELPIVAAARQLERLRHRRRALIRKLDDLDEAIRMVKNEIDARSRDLTLPMEPTERETVCASCGVRFTRPAIYGCDAPQLHSTAAL